MEPAASVLWRDILHRADGTILKCQAIEFIESDFNTTISNLKVSWWEQHCLPCERRRFDGSMGQTWPDLLASGKTSQRQVSGTYREYIVFDNDQVEPVAVSLKGT